MIESKGLPSAGRISLLHQENKSRFIIHLLYAPPLERGRCLIIELFLQHIFFLTDHTIEVLLLEIGNNASISSSKKN